MAVDKITWAQAGAVTEPGGCMFNFRWVIITADDLAIWQQFPRAAFTLYQRVGSEDEFYLGAFELPDDLRAH